MYRVLYRAYRPEVFSEMLGQEHIVKILKNQLKSGTVNHAYLFCGTRGTGKTTAARLLAKGVNCLADGEKPCGECANCRAIKEGTFLDLIEIDAASNNGVDNIREIRDSANYAPAMGGKKVYIIDEVHMLSGSAFNALLKTLEEPPEDVMFILCTTEPEKLPATVLSRCMRMDFRRVSEQQLSQAFRRICSDRNMEMEDAALKLIVTNADGSVRDGLTILDQCIAGQQGRLTREDVLDSLGAVGEDTYIRLTDCVLEHDPAGGLKLIEELIENGKDARQILQGWLGHYRNLLMTKFIKNPEDMLNMSVENVEMVRDQSSDADLEDINRAIIEIAGTLGETRTSTQPRILLEVSFVKLATSTKDGSVVIPAARAERKTAGAAGRRARRENSQTPESGKPDGAEAAAAEQRNCGPAGAQDGSDDRGREQGDSSNQAGEHNRNRGGEFNNNDREFNDDNGRGTSAGNAAGAGKPDDESGHFSASEAGSAGGEADADGSSAGMAADMPSDGREVSAGEMSAAEEADAAAGASPAGETVPALEEMNDIWEAVIEDGTAQRGDFSLLRAGAVPVKMNDGEFVVSASGMAESYIERNMSMIAELIEKYSGVPKKIIIAGEENGEEEKASAEEVAEKISRSLGIEVDIEE